MNENPGGTPNPLNPAPAGAEPAPTDVSTASNSEPAQQSAQPTAEPVTEPSTQGSVVEPEKKSKKGIIIAIILLLLVAIGGAVAAILILKPFGNGDAVPAAIQKLFEGNAPTKISMNGVITMTSENPSLPVSTIKIDFNSGIDTVAKGNYANIKVTATLLNDNEFSFDASEVHTSDGDLYLKLSNVTDVLESLTTTTVQDCTGYNIYDSNCLDVDYDYLDLDYDYDYDYELDFDDYYDDDYTYGYGTSDLSALLGFTSIFEVIDDDWIRISGSDFSNITNIIPTTNNSTQCLIDAADSLGDYGDDFAKLYKDNSFINYSTDNLKITQKKNQLYLLSFDADKLADFLNSMATSGFINDLIACTGGAATRKISVEEVKEIIKNLPALYVEIDDDHNFTRVYLDMDTGDDSTKIIVDLSFEYPANITIEEPDEYIDINEVLTRALNSFYGTSIFDQTESLLTF